jgi:hypothetical protein
MAAARNAIAQNIRALATMLLLLMLYPWIVF